MKDTSCCVLAFFAASDGIVSKHCSQLWKFKPLKHAASTAFVAIENIHSVYSLLIDTYVKDADKNEALKAVDVPCVRIKHCGPSTG